MDDSDKSMQLVLAGAFAMVREKYIEVIEHTKNMNTPARRLYEKIGFEYRGKQNLFAENTGWTDFLYYELPLQEKFRYNQEGFTGNRVKNADSYLLDIERMNGTDLHTLDLQTGNVLKIQFETLKGSLYMEIKAPDGTTIYCGNGKETTGFTVNITESGVYTIVVCARHAKGGVSKQEKRDDIYRYELMMPLKEKWDCYHIPMKAEREGGYDIIMASEMLGILPPREVEQYKS